MKIVFAGTPEFAVPSLQILIDSSHDVLAVYTQPDRPAGRGRAVKESPIKQLAQQHQLTVQQPSSLKDIHQQDMLAQLRPDLMVVVAYGLLLPKAVLEIPRYGCINVHPSLLPRWRGAAPIQHSLLAGDTTTGVSIMQLDEGMDSGPILSQAIVPICESDTSQTLHDSLSQLGAQLLLKVIDDLPAITPLQQDPQQVTFAPKLSKQEACIDWRLPALELAHKIQAFNPWPVAFTYFLNQPLRLLQAQAIATDTSAPPGHVCNLNAEGIDVATGSGLLRLKQLQMPGKRPVSANDFINAYRQQLTASKIPFSQHSEGTHS